jgi:hypothetical protein
VLKLILIEQVICLEVNCEGALNEIHVSLPILIHGLPVAFKLLQDAFLDLKEGAVRLLLNHGCQLLLPI